MTRPHGNRASQSLRLGLFTSLVCVLFPLGAATRGDDGQAATGDAADCGTMALGTLLLLEGRQTEPAVLLANLRPSSAAGPSLQELRDAAAACGLTLRGVILNKDERAVDRPMIVFLKRPGHGHFCVVRPVGHTGKLAQVIDPNMPPYVTDKHVMFAAPEWTWIALIPDRRPAWGLRITWGLIGGAASASLGWAGSRWRRVRRESVGGNPVGDGN
jgi:Peptidase C39 family